MFLQKAVLWPEAGVIVRIGSREKTRYRRSCIRICTCQITKTEIAIERPAKFSYMQNRFGRRAEEWRVSQSFWRVFVESKTRISDRMTKMVWQRESKLIRYEGLSLSDGWQQRLSETFFDRFLMRKTWTLRLRNGCRQRTWLEDLQSGNAMGSVVGCQMSATFSTDLGDNEIRMLTA